MRVVPVTVLHVDPIVLHVDPTVLHVDPMILHVDPTVLPADPVQEEMVLPMNGVPVHKGIPWDNLPAAAEAVPAVNPPMVIRAAVAAVVMADVPGAAAAGAVLPVNG
jgi:hypothetical protein